jgi:hypothetical protein
MEKLAGEGWVRISSEAVQPRRRRPELAREVTPTALTQEGRRAPRKIWCRDTAMSRGTVPLSWVRTVSMHHSPAKRPLPLALKREMAIRFVALGSACEWPRGPERASTRPRVEKVPKARAVGPGGR